MQIHLAKGLDIASTRREALLLRALQPWRRGGHFTTLTWPFTMVAISSGFSVMPWELLTEHVIDPVVGLGSCLVVSSASAQFRSVDRLGFFRPQPHVIVDRVPPRPA